MPPAKAAEANRAAEVVPEIRPGAPWRVASLDVLEGAALRVTFMDGARGEVRMQAFLASDQVSGTVFEPLRDPAEFARARVVRGAVEWPCGADLAPDAMYDKVRESGVWTLD